MKVRVSNELCRYGVDMGFKKWAMSRLESGPVDPDRMIDVQHVAMWQGPMVLGALQDQGIMAHIIEDHSAKITGEAFIPRSRVMVRASDYAAAAEVIHDVLNGEVIEPHFDGEVIEPSFDGEVIEPKFDVNRVECRGSDAALE